MILHGDCLEKLKSMEDDSVDSLVTDPPAGISFMGKAWDDDKGGRKQWIAWLSTVMKEALRVMKPGSHGLVWAIPRTSHWTATALEDAGFEVRDVVTHLFGSGFPKSLDISKAIDKAAGVEREVVGKSNRHAGGSNNNYAQDDWTKANAATMGMYVTAPSTPEAKQWQGYGTALKPASEHWILIRKPCSEKTVAANVLRHGTGGLNIDASRITLKPGEVTHGSGANQGNEVYGDYSEKRIGVPNVTSTQGRFPANLLLSHNDDCVEVCSEGCAVAQLDAQSGLLKTNSGKIKSSLKDNTGYGGYTRIEQEIKADSGGASRFFYCTPGCAVAELDRQSLAGGMHSAGKARPKQLHKGDFGVSEHGNRERLADNRFGDSGGASRFFYCAKASKSEKNAGCEGIEPKKSDYRPGDEEGRNTIRERLHNSIPKANHHPTVKPLKLMSYLIKMITPPGGVVLDPFVGSGSTGVAAIQSGFKFIGIEREKEYVEIANKRIYHAMPEFKKQIKKDEQLG